MPRRIPVLPPSLPAASAARSLLDCRRQRQVPVAAAETSTIEKRDYFVEIVSR